MTNIFSQRPPIATTRSGVCAYCVPGEQCDYCTPGTVGLVHQAYDRETGQVVLRCYRYRCQLRTVEAKVEVKTAARKHAA